MQITDMHDLQGFAMGWVFPSFVWFPCQYLLYLFGEVSLYILFLTQLYVLADNMGVGVMTPYTLKQVRSHSFNSSFTDISILNMFLKAILNRDLLQDGEGGILRG